MDIQNLVSSSMPPTGAADGTHVTVFASNAGYSDTGAAQKWIVAAKPSYANMRDAVDNINKSLQQRNSTLQFSIDGDTNDIMFKMLDSSTGEVIRQYPSEVAIAISEAIDQEMKRGLLLNQKA